MDVLSHLVHSKEKGALELHNNSNAVNRSITRRLHDLRALQCTFLLFSMLFRHTLCALRGKAAKKKIVEFCYLFKTQSFSE